jgi:hypothetical protein
LTLKSTEERLGKPAAKDPKAKGAKNGATPAKPAPAAPADAEAGR